MTLIHLGDRTIAMPNEPQPCGRCGAMSAVFNNRYGETYCCRCDVEDRSVTRTGKGERL